MVIIYICELTMLPARSSVYFHYQLGQTQRKQETRPYKTSNVAISWAPETGLHCLGPIRSKAEFYLSFIYCGQGCSVGPVEDILDSCHISHVFYIVIVYKLMQYNSSINF